MNSTPPKVIYLVIIIMGAIAFVGVLSLCLTLFCKNYADPAVLTSIISITSGAIGALGAMLTSTRSVHPGAVTNSTVTTTTPAATDPTDDDPTPVVVTNAPSNPVQTEEAHHPISPPGDKPNTNK